MMFLRGMKFIFLIVISIFLQSASVFSQTNSVNTDSTVIDSLNIKKLPENSGDNEDEDKTDQILMVRYFESFVDSINSTIPDTMPFYDWITNDIHIHKFDFSEVKDTLTIVLEDSIDHYTHPHKGRVTSGFGMRHWRYHYGMDIKLYTGDSVYCAFNGRVRISTYSRTYGNVVVVRHDNGLETLYAHMSKRLVDIDSVITSGSVLGLGGNTGRSYGSHLHFEIRYFDEALDPRDVVDFENFTVLHDTLYMAQCNFAYREELKELAKMKYVYVRSGNTLSHLAVKYGTTVTQICRLNGISRNKILRIGERLRVR